MFKYFLRYWPEAIGLSLASSVLISSLMAVVLVSCAQNFIVPVEVLVVGLTVCMWINYSFSVVIEEKNRSAAVANMSGYNNFTPNAVYTTNQYSVYDLQASHSTFFLSLSTVTSVITILITVLILCLRKNISAVIRQVCEARHVIFKVPCILLQPVVTFILTTFLFIYVFTILVYLENIVVPIVDNCNGIVNFHYGIYRGYSFYELVVPLFGCWWVFQFMLACEYIIIAGALADWYFKCQRNSCCPTMATTLYVLRYQLGTAAYGSLIVAAVVAVTSIVQGASSFKHLIKGLIFIREKCCRTYDVVARNCCSYLANFFSIVNINAYVCAAIFGTSFYKSGERALVLLAKKHPSTLLPGWSQIIFLLSSQIAVAIFTAIVAFTYFRYRLGPETSIFDTLLLVSVAGIMAFMIARVFFNVYGQTLTTMVFCYVEDAIRHNGLALCEEKASGSLYLAPTQYQRPTDPSQRVF